ncbi:MAG: hypothetical protein M1814_006466 [Vezdaea aestivalis]|nr:MAG: hypothetical protein M1814_006466 [Vezdaea aestivalis]
MSASPASTADVPAPKLTPYYITRPQGIHLYSISNEKESMLRDEPLQKISKLAIAAETEDDKYDTETHLECYTCPNQDIMDSTEKLAEVTEAVKKAMTFARQEEIKAWEQELTPCEHTLCLEQGPAKKIESQDLGQCSMCNLKENLWLCLQCGNLGCGREQHGGVDGNSHGLAHATESQHAVAVKLGSITPEGTADVYCYSCNDERVDTELAAHLTHWGISIADREKTEKSLTELQIEQNFNHDFSMTTEDGRELEPIFGEGFTGLKNIGNSCYLASILQCLFSSPGFKARYYHPEDTPPPTNDPAQDLETQLCKIADGLLSGRYSKPDADIGVVDDVKYQKGLAPSMFKHLIGRGHEEFSTMRQQDAFEFLMHLFKNITRSPHPEPRSDPVKDFRFIMEQRLQCLSCKKVRYRRDEQDNISIAVPVRRKPATPGDGETDTINPEEFMPISITECLNIFTSPEKVELTCSSCGSKSGFSKRTGFSTFPKLLAVNARRFEKVNWVAIKLDIPLIVPDEPIDMTAYKSSGLQNSEEALPEDTPSAAPAFSPDATALASLEAMGFLRPRSERALHATGNSDAEAAMNWLFAHMEDPDIDAPLDLGPSTTTTVEADPEKMNMLAAMGFTPAQSTKALRETGGNVERAVEWVFSHPDDMGDVGSGPANPSEPNTAEEEVAGSDTTPAMFQVQSIVCHKGRSIHAGHYVAFIRKTLPGSTEEDWVLFNDEKVVRAVDAEEMKRTAYVYFFRRIDRQGT